MDQFARNVLRQRFVMAALSSRSLEHLFDSYATPGHIAKAAFDLADALMREHDSRPNAEPEP